MRADPDERNNSLFCKRLRNVVWLNHVLRILYDTMTPYMLPFPLQLLQPIQCVPILRPVAYTVYLRCICIITDDECVYRGA